MEPPVIWADEAVASRPRNSPLRESGLKGQLSALTARVSGFSCPDVQRQRRGVFRASGGESGRYGVYRAAPVRAHL